MPGHIALRMTLPLSLMAIVACSLPSGRSHSGLNGEWVCPDFVITEDGSRTDCVFVPDDGVGLDGGGDSTTEVAQDIPGGDEDVLQLLPSGLLERGGLFMGVSERFNRYYTDPTWTPDRVIFVSRDGAGSGSSREDPASVEDGFSAVGAGEQITFLRDEMPYQGCWELDSDSSGTYDAPVVIFAERNSDGTRGVHVQCCDSGRRSCFNLEGANHVAVDGFALEGSRYGIRSVGLGYSGAEHQRGVAMLNNEGFDQCADPFFSGQSDWIVIENNIARGGGECDGHGIYLSNGGDWMIVRHNNLYHNSSSDFQINADPISTCSDVGIDYTDDRCDGLALEGQGQGVSEFVLVESNYFHNTSAQGPNFTSVRNSVVRNNIIGFYGRHGTSFWQETSNPALGSSNNIIHHNLFISTNSQHVLQFEGQSNNNDIRNNILLGINTDGTSVSVSGLNVDDSSSDNVYVNNYYVATSVSGHSPNELEFTRNEFDSTWFAAFPLDGMGTAQDFRPTVNAPFLDLGSLLEATPLDFSGMERPEMVDLGPFER